MRKHITNSLAVTLLALGAGCSLLAPSGPPGGKTAVELAALAANDLAQLEQARTAYCDNTQNLQLRAAAIQLIRFYVPEFPADGICTELSTLLTDVLLRKTGAPVAPIDANARASPGQ